MILSHFYTLAEAEEIRQAYASWIGKTAHIGAGCYDILNTISIRENAEHKTAKEKLYLVEFEFKNSKVFCAYEFSINNGLIPLTGIGSETLRGD